MSRRFRAHEVSLREQVVEAGIMEKPFAQVVQWEAYLRAHQYGEPDVEMVRYGNTAEEAYQNLRKAVEEQGWELP
jgi:poly-beta-hydroxyalkanoate depolymerase